MELKIYKNEYGYERVDCLFCGFSSYYRKEKPDPLMYLKRHIINESKNEALDYCTKAEAPTGKHLAYLKAHAKERPPVITKLKYQFDTDLKVINNK